MKTIITFTILLIVCNIACINQSNKNVVENDKQNATNIDNSKINKSEDSKLNKETQIKASADTLSVALTLFRDEKESTVDVSETFIEDDGVRLNISVVEKGYLLVLYKGSKGKAQVLFPDKNFYQGTNQVLPNKSIIIPAEGWFFFDEKKGVEKIFVVFSENENLLSLKANPSETVNNLENAELQNNDAESFISADGNLVRIIELKHK